jgi:hypothetical protein
VAAAPSANTSAATDLETLSALHAQCGEKHLMPSPRTVDDQVQGRSMNNSPQVNFTDEFSLTRLR